jgi:hypothetical protein
MSGAQWLDTLFFLLHTVTPFLNLIQRNGNLVHTVLFFFAT